MRYIMSFVLALLIAGSAQAKIVSKDVEYSLNDTKLKGTLVYDDAKKAPAPGVLIVPEWWGDNDYIKGRAKQMAEKGYVAFVADMFGGGKSTDKAAEATEWTKPLYTDRNLMRATAKAALDTLKMQPQVDKNNIAVIGFCFGGTVALELARSGEDVKGVAAFHAGLQFPEPIKGPVKAHVLVLNGASDPMVPFTDTQKFIEEMDHAKADLQIVEYSNTLHAYTNPGADEIAKPNGLVGKIGYNKTSETRAFKALDDFYAEIFK